MIVIIGVIVKVDVMVVDLGCFVGWGLFGVVGIGGVIGSIIVSLILRIIVGVRIMAIRSQHHHHHLIHHHRHHHHPQ